MNDAIVRPETGPEPGDIGRREFFDRVAQVVGVTAALGFAADRSGVAAGSAERQGQAAGSPIVPPDDKRLTTGTADYDASGTKVSGYLARQAGGGKRPAVLVISENRGLTPHIQDVARRVGLEGFLAFAPDMLSPLGGSPPDTTKAVEMIRSLNNDETVARLAAAVRFLAAHAESTGKVGVVGFCWGGGLVNQLAAAGTSLNAGVAYYGRVLPAAQVGKVSCPLLLHYGALDQGINAGIPEFEAALKSEKKVYELYVYEGANHAFNNDTTDRYNKDAAQLAWTRTIAFFRKYLK